MSRPLQTDYPAYYNTYISLVKSDNILHSCEVQLEEINAFLSFITEERSAYAYQPEKWTIKEMIQHLIDGERIFSYRLLAIGRGDTTSLPSFEQNQYVTNAHSNQRTWESLVKELINVRTSTIDLLSSLSQTDLANRGQINGNSITANSLAYILVGHLTHHINVLKDKYLV